MQYNVLTCAGTTVFDAPYMLDTALFVPTLNDCALVPATFEPAARL